ncbi:TetR/AcrR family transcriptional regulator C-terminal domain-containing protein [Streptomyces sp. H27-D2]|uniref:TetR/AcrR family transcriptional regulator C-terminal domain-containing protein n=1 Tax=Streptomyces sp. H27-D2 TaxID=3046304 RepID=UPI002DBD1DBD|nr:TetR/AcrR family transcriptional regulator C-terminal domain-containing protein [Streptomyces sp. H27-D2]MEC4019350.1 TetR/AcrR family transcriptional regulator C-terminal domain-containing protein [Streptomyces sp. H27-D2]
MTKKQAAKSPRTRLDPEAVVRAALELLDDKGADAVSIRGIADRLGVRMNTVLWHAKTKQRLLELMADAIAADVRLDGLPEPWEERVRELAHRYRRALLGYRDGAAIVTGIYAAEPATLRFADTMIEALLDGGLPEREAAWACWSVVYFLLGLVQEEQASPVADGNRFTKTLASGGYPALARVAAHLEETSFDGRFDYGLSLILRSLREEAAARGVSRD